MANDRNEKCVLSFWVPYPVTKKNGRRQGGAPSWRYRQWENTAWETLPIPAEPHHQVAVEIYLSPPLDGRRRDADNGAQSILDLLVLRGVISDDSLDVVQRLEVIYKPAGRIGAEVFIFNTERPLKD